MDAEANAGMSARDGTVVGSPNDVGASGAPALRFDARTRRLLEGPIVGTLLRLAAPNVLVMFVQAAGPPWSGHPGARRPRSSGSPRAGRALRPSRRPARPRHP